MNAGQDPMQINIEFTLTFPLGDLTIEIQKWKGLQRKGWEWYSCWTFSSLGPIDRMSTSICWQGPKGRYEGPGSTTESLSPSLGTPSNIESRRVSKRCRSPKMEIQHRDHFSFHIPHAIHGEADPWYQSHVGNDFYHSTKPQLRYQRLMHGKLDDGWNYFRKSQQE